jgi:hypothetical protein
MNLSSKEFPDRIAPYIVMSALNQPVDVAAGSFQLVTTEKVLGTVDGRLYFRWLPSTAMEFDGSYSGPPIDVGAEDVTLRIGENGLSAPVIISSTTGGPVPAQIRGVFRNKATIAARPTFDRLQFCLVNFPEYIGDPIRYETDGSRGSFSGRLQVASPGFLCIVDEIREARELRKTAAEDAGFVISHVGELKPVEGCLDEASTQQMLDVLRLFFGFLRGAWSGPVFPQGITEHQKNWEQFAGWKVSEAREVPTWLPQRNPLDLNRLFSGFVERHSDPAWQSPLRTALHWYVEANSSGTAHETRLVLGQVALELLAWLELVVTRQRHSRSDFKRLSAAGRIRSLLHQLYIPCGMPSHFAELQSLQEGDAFDGPGVVARLRNALVHAGEKNPAPIKSVSGVQWWQAGQLALQYVELSLLALCGYQGKYARRCWRGWKGDDEVFVPWTRAG